MARRAKAAAPKQTEQAEAQTYQWQRVDPPAQSEAEQAFAKTAGRLMDAVRELNEALKEASENREMRVELWHDGKVPRSYDYRIYKLSHFTMSFAVQEIGSRLGAAIVDRFPPPNRERHEAGRTGDASA